MSMRGVEYVFVRGTCVSTCMFAPSKLHVTVVQSFGLPNQHNLLVVDSFLLHMRFDKEDEELVHVWAQTMEEAPSSCGVA